MPTRHPQLDTLKKAAEWTLLTRKLSLNLAGVIDIGGEPPMARLSFWANDARMVECDVPLDAPPSEVERRIAALPI